MPPARALIADDHEVFAETLRLGSWLACGKTLLGVTAARLAAPTLVVCAVVTAAVPSVRHEPLRVEAAPVTHPTAKPVTFVPRRTPVVVTAPHLSRSPAAAVRTAPRPIRPAGAKTPTPAQAPARAPAPKPTRAHAPAPAPAPRAAPPRPASPEPAAPPATPPAAEPPPVEAPTPVVPPLPPLPPVPAPGLPNVELPSLPLGP